ncbi:FKBP-type peptidyl-prolyl cis-trans isomerase [Nucisporomicrobium flavum]|jgi:peptidylprolyl isomerase|uniref:FKBP-type peptidyl-prolyl cis-trans isomerase n=1 Tax=Nucisporomicrobium flavum TaxID=2785915 RepID=UPI0018F705C7|nr:FKBP-type peptidyl-prolyl cis-trans isomerase [Nucisporomicrobium flavum]
MSVQDKTAGKRRGQALTGALAGVAVIAVLVAVFIGIQVSDDDDKPAATSAPAAATSEPAQAQPSAPAAEPSAPAAQTPLDPALKEKPVVKAGKGKVTKLVVKELIAGKGPKLTAGQTIQANYVGVTYKDGKQFDSSWDRGQPAEFPVGVGQLIEGWDKGLVGVPVGSRVQLDIPAAQAYGENATGGRPAGDLRFVVDVLAAQ